MERRKLHSSNRFDRDVSLAIRRGKNTEKLKAVMELLANQQSLPVLLKDHPLRGNWSGCRDLHIEPDWLLIYKCDEENVWLVRTGTHADLFR